MKITRPKSLKELAVEEVRARIVDGRMRLGAQLSENALATELGISKTPVREALLQLQAEGLVEVMPQRGTYVFTLKAEQVTLISELREALETAAIGWAIARNGKALGDAMAVILEDMEKAHRRGDTVRYHVLDGRYHESMIELAGNPYLLEAYEQIGSRIQALRSRLSREAALNSRSLADHRRMLELVRAGDTRKMQALLRAHIDQTRRWYLDAIAESGVAGAEFAS